VVGLPLDLSDEVSAAKPVCPWAPVDPKALARLDDRARPVDIDVVRLERTGTDPIRAAGTVIVDGTTVDVDADVYPNLGGFPLVQWRGRPGLSALTADQGWALLRLLEGLPV
jgi:hypothetical protein